MSLRDTCANCGGGQGLHHYHTNQCPVGGVEAPDGRQQEWKTSVYRAVIPPSNGTWKTNPHDPVDAFYVGDSRGLTKREYFAAIAMQGLLANGAVLEKSAITQNATRLADYLIDALNKE